MKKLIKEVPLRSGFILHIPNLFTKDIPKTNVLATYYASEEYSVYKKVAVGGDQKECQRIY